MAGLLTPQAGRLPSTRRRAGAGAALCWPRHALKREASVRDHLRYWAGLFEGGAREQVVGQALDLTRVMSLPVRALSQGQARRLALSRLIIAPRPIWLLDEPAAALDDAGKAALNELIGSHRAGGGIVVAAVHEPLGPAPSQTIRVPR
jgi:heme exporter protein A